MSTPELEQFLRKQYRSLLSATLADAQDVVPTASGQVKTLYRLYTQDIRRFATRDLVRRYFPGATLLYGVGLDSGTQAADEDSLTIEIVTSKPDAFQRVLDLAGDIRQQNEQFSVLITRQSVISYEVTKRTITHGEL